MRNIFIFCAAVSCLAMMSFSHHADAVVYKYTDKGGTPCFVDNLQSVPEQYRATVVIVSGELKEGEQDPDSPKVFIEQYEPARGGGATAGSSSGAGRRSTFSGRLLKSILIVLISVMAYLYVSKVSHIKHKKKIVPYVRMGLIGIASLSLIVLHARDVMTIFGLLGHEVKEVRKASEEKGKKAAEFIKTIDTAIGQAQEAQKAMPPAEEPQK